MTQELTAQATAVLEKAGLLRGLLIASVLLIVLPFIWSVGKAIYRRSHKIARTPVSTSRRLITLSAMLIGAIWCIRFAVGYYDILIAEQSSLTLLEQFFDSVAHTLQTFSMDEDYTRYITSGKDMVTLLAGSSWATLYGIYASVMNLAAPIAGGAIIFEILTSIFPQLRLSFSYWAIWREKVYFSELNAGSLALAKSIRDSEYVGPAKKRGSMSLRQWFGLLVKSYFCRATLVFTDTYTDDESEKSSELLLEAKSYGAICVRDDLAHIRKNRFGRRKIFLIDEQEINNLQTLTELSNSYNYRFLQKTEIYLFSQDDIYTQVEARFYERLRNEYGFAGPKKQGDHREDDKEAKPVVRGREKQLPMIIPVQRYRNLVTNLLTELPLYEPLVHKPTDENGVHDLNVTIFGSGKIGTEMFLSTYWFGQMLDCRLHITVVSREEEDAFRGRIAYMAPELWPSTEAKNPLLVCDGQGGFSEPYATVSYIQADVHSEAFLQRLAVDAANTALLDTDYFMVALGSDAENLSMTEKLRRCVGAYHNAKAPAKKAVIAYVVCNADLNASLNTEQGFCSHTEGQPDLYLRAIGSIEDEFSVQNIFMETHRVAAYGVGQAYVSADTAREDRMRSYKKRMKDEYTYWADLARAAHVGYKVFSAGLLKASVFDGAKARSAAWKTAYEHYAQLAKEERFDSKENDRLAWLEHRRWCAFMRTKGFVCTEAYENYYELTGNHKHLPLKLHPCLVECSQAKTVDMDFDKKLPEYDPLDVFTYEVEQYRRRIAAEQGKDDSERKPTLYKKYDYPKHEFHTAKLSVREAAWACGVAPWRIRRLCRIGRFESAVLAEGHWMIAEDDAYLKAMKK